MSNANNNKPGDRRRDGRDKGSSRDRGTAPPDFADAVARLESAVARLVAVAKEQTFDKAARFIDETSTRIESDLRFNRIADEEANREREHRRQSRRTRHGRKRHRYWASYGPRTARLTRDPTNAKIAGVCSGIAHYFGFEPWCVRLCALTGLVFLPGIVFPAYWVAYFVMGTPAKGSSPGDADSWSARSSTTRSSAGSRRGFRDADAAQGEPAPEPVPPSASLRYTAADFSQIELRLRRMETFITSGRYELDKELRKIERESAQDHAG